MYALMLKVCLVSQESIQKENEVLKKKIQDLEERLETAKLKYYQLGHRNASGGGTGHLQYILPVPSTVPCGTGTVLSLRI